MYEGKPGIRLKFMRHRTILRYPTWDCEPMQRDGYTLFEVMIALAMAGIIALFGLGGLIGTGRNYALRHAAIMLTADISRAAREATVRNRTVVLRRTGSDAYTIDFVGSRRLTGGASFGPGAPDSVTFKAFGPAGNAETVIPVVLADRMLIVQVGRAGWVGLP